MRNLKKFLALVLAMLMVVSAGATVSAYSDVADEDAYAAAIAALTEWGIVMGTELGEAEDGSDALYEPNADVTRWQMALMMARTLAPEVTDDEWAEGMEIFGDVTEWYGAIAYAYIEGIVNGVSTEELVFKPNDGIKYQDGLIMALRALGYEVDCSGIVYWLDAYTQARAIGLTENIAISKPEKTMTRGEMAQLIYNMINLPFADGSYSLAIKYYGAEAPAEPEIPAVPTQFVVTATPGQAYVKGQHTDATLPEGETAAALLGLQELEAGIPAGDIIYVKASKLGIADADADKYLHYAVTLYDYDAQYNDFVAYEIGEAPVVVRNTAITAGDTTVKVGGYTYYLVDSLTDAARRNEIVVFTGDADKKDALVLLKNKDGNIVDFDGNVLATYVYTLGATNYYVAEATDSENNEGKDNVIVISEAKALERFGIKTADDAVFTEYVTLDGSDLKNSAPYQLSLFDDNGDGKYDRAIYNKVYMTVYNAGTDGKDTVGIAYDKHANLKWAGEDVKTTGTLFTYTYNPQLMQVNVIEKVAAMPAGMVTNIILDGNKVVIGGNTYVIASADTELKMGADLQTKAGKGYDDIAKGYIDYTDISTFFSVGSDYNFYAYNGYILAGKKITPADEDANWKYFVSEGAVAYDSTAIYVDGYVANGEKTTIEITVIDEDVNHPNVDKDTALADMNIFDLGEFLADTKALFAKGNIFKVVARGDGTYRLLTNKFDGDVEAFVEAEKNYEDFDLAEAIDGLYIFDDNKSVEIEDKEDRIRTNKNTVFYFVKYNANGGKIVDLDLYRGTPKDGWSIDAEDDDVVIFADKIGYGTKTENAYNGTASTVVVYYTNLADINGFNVNNRDVDYDIVYVTKFNDNAKLSIVPASEVTDETAVPYYYKTTGTNAIDMVTGNTIGTIYAASKITANGFYKLYDGKLLGAMLTADEIEESFVIDTIDTAYVEDIDFADEWLIFGSIDEDDEISAIKAVNKITEKAISTKVKNDSTDDVKALLVANTTAGKVNNVYFLEEELRAEDSNTLTIVILEETLTKYTCKACAGKNCGCTCESYAGEVATCKTGCKCTCCDTTIKGVKGTYTATGATTVTREVVIAGADFAKGVLNNAVIHMGATAEGYVNGVSSIKIAKDTADNVILNTAKFVESEVVDDTITFSVGRTLVDDSFDAETLEAGLYLITISLDDADSYERVVTVILDTRA